MITRRTHTGHRGGAPDPLRHGRDRKAEVVRPAPGTHRFATQDAPSVAVIGGGIAGLAATTLLVERGARVTLYEAGPSLGGRLAGWPTTLADGSEVTMSRGFHAFFRQYYNLRGLLRRTDPTLSRLTPLPDYPLRHSGGLTDSFARVPRTPPLSALGFVALSPTFGWRDLSAMDARTALPLLDVRVPQTYERFDSVDALSFLESVRFPEAAHHLAFEVFSRSFFADPRELSAAELLLMFHIYFLGSAEGLLFDVPNEPFPQALWDPLGDYVQRLGADIRTSTPVHEVAPRDEGAEVRTDASATRHDAVVLATDTPGLRTVLAGSPHLGTPTWRAGISALRTAPSFLVSRLWLDRPVRADRPGFLGTSGYDGLDNISVLDRYEGEAARWARRTGGSVVELHAYAVGDASDRKEVQERLIGQLHRIYPETRDASLVDARHEWRADCPLFTVGSYSRRPTVRTPHPWLTLAGDAVRCDLPVALMERAATTGFLAANALLAEHGVRGQVLWTVPRAGRSRSLRALAGLAAR
ncbi:FAD-dependent oxidoreductase [Streptomyces sp. TRM66268-LWL]|uniref:FAD-dependent oxidoreductase n=1 Tax=Streptomyces polyasparticus TaxID=2767826 RepID=A0ABR7SKH4_9ACTN|nr:NAD(P)/FAD-dependent oxidoreductase [Streptomyces polyasparticus]MBC9715210.1 FAD-dependent oxidoreductase [Streptomyces polyasparticus]